MLPELETIEEEFQSSALATGPKDPGKRTFELVADQDVIELAARCHAAFPDVPLKGVDIIRDYKTNKLYVLELNCTSNTWHISSNYFAVYRTGPITEGRTWLPSLGMEYCRRCADRADSLGRYLRLPAGECSVAAQHQRNFDEARKR